jgi:hypothetical protein
MTHRETEHWLARYASDYHSWSTIATTTGHRAFQRRLGLVEYSFDTDGSEYGGRADLHTLLTLEISRAGTSKEGVRRRIALAWANLRLQHPILMSRTVEDGTTGARSFVIDVQGSADEALRKAREGIVWVDDYYKAVDEQELYEHCYNVGRIIEPQSCLSKLHVLPLVRLQNGNYELRFLIVMAHQIADGLSGYSFFSHFIRLLNTQQSNIEREIEVFGKEEEIWKRLPLAQEDLYPKVAGNKARERWFWAIIRVLRHVRKTLPPTFVNPLRRATRLPSAIAYPPTFAKLFNYTPEARPPMNSGFITAALSATASARLVALCREMKVSIGAGCFALAGLSMMEIYEKRYPEVQEKERLPFTASFPLNPRAFFAAPTPAESCMLTFSEGIVMPFLSSALPVEGRFKLIARHANRELRMYQKRSQGQTLDEHSPGRLLANGYLFQTERVDSKLPPHRRTGINPQGTLPANVGKYGATCGVSSVGSTAGFFKPGTYSLEPVKGEEVGEHFAADFRSLKTGVRARDNEFLIGSSTDVDGIVNFGVSYDRNAISLEAAEMWTKTIRGLLEGEGENRARL